MESWGDGLAFANINGSVVRSAFKGESMSLSRKLLHLLPILTS